jgi:predicted O-methyltransferase YrrM
MRTKGAGFRWCDEGFGGMRLGERLRRRYSFGMNRLRAAERTWEAVESYFNERLTPSDAILDAAMKAIDAAGLPAISVAAHEGRLLWILARIQGARNILEIGTLGGYSTIWLARALAPGGKLITLEFDPKHAAVARENIARAGLAEIVELRLGKALDSLPVIGAEGRGPFDLIFIDADKKNNWEYFVWALKLSRLGSVIIVDNVVRDGAVVDASSTDPDIRGIRRFIEMLAKEKRVSATAMQATTVLRSRW